MRILLIAAVAFFLMACSGGGDANSQNESSSSASASSSGVSLAASEAQEPDKVEDAERVAEPLSEDLAANFTMQTLEGEELSLESLRGRYVVVNFWATWCVPCRKEMPYFQEITERYPDQVVVLGVNMREDAERIRPFIEEFGFTFPILLDPPNALILEHEVRGLPVSYVVGPEGEIVYRRVGEILPTEFDPWLEEKLNSG